MEIVLILILTVTTIAAAVTGMNAVNAVMGTAIAGATATMKAVVVAVSVLTIMTAAAEMISVRSHALNQGHLPLIKIMYAVVRNIRTITMTGSKKLRAVIRATGWLIKCAGITRTFYSHGLCSKCTDLAEPFLPLYFLFTS